MNDLSGQETELDARQFRDALGCFATGITIVTCFTGNGMPVGLTVNSFNSVSLDPPLILFSIGRNSRSLEAFRAADRFAVHILGEEQTGLSSQFASGADDKWTGVDFRTGGGGAPLLPGALATFECARHELVEGGDHVIFLGRVMAMTSQGGGRPLLYFRGAYHGLAPVGG